VVKAAKMVTVYVPRSNKGHLFFFKDLLSSPPVPVFNFDSQCLQVDQQVVSTLQLISFLLQEPILFHSIKLLHDEASNCTYNKDEDGNSGGVTDN